MVLYEPRSGGERRSARTRVPGEGTAKAGEKWSPPWEDHPRAEGRGLVATKEQSLHWLEELKKSQRLTNREENRKEEILDIFREFQEISARRYDLRDFPPTRYS